MLKIGRNEPCWCGSGKKYKACHYPEMPKDMIKNKQMENLAREYRTRHQILIKTPEQIQKIKAACKLAATILDKVCEKAMAGVTTGELNSYALELHEKAQAIPASLNYGEPPFPGGICTSINEVICHGIPGDRKLQEGDIVNIDVACILDEYYGDCSRMVTIGKVSEEAQLVVDVSYECLMKSIEILRPGVPVSAIGNKIEDVASEYDCSVVDQFVGHGVGILFHEGPQVAHHRNSNPIKLVPGMTFTIEPMINAGVKEAIIDNKDGWTARTRDGKPSAQWEHTILITDTGHEILTPWKR